ncbi:hypothetical protein ED733_003678 [Metarhizium rileyi]|uniref:Peptidyl-arginine deiminase, Porphyromonas-type n=1 Tax=Metarhizium rileyi (strain RCEF 4871) TaxID=1649241 RepID=A0A5C6GB29_METRR|nr:hypothetical protein ED733_003678 [Metarhizium rileyi]
MPSIKDYYSSDTNMALSSREVCGDLLKDAQNEVVSIANAIAEFEPVFLYSNSETIGEAKSGANENVSIGHAEETSHLWMRDFGPIFVKSRNGKALRGADFNFNYWGNKRAQTGDERMAKIAAKYVSGSPALSAVIIAEGGGMEVDGEGTFMATESSLISNNRDPGMSKVQIENELSRLLGVRKFLWLAGEVGRETTDCHIDALVRFIRPGVILLSRPLAEGPGKYSVAYLDAKTRLSNATDAQGRLFTLYDCIEPDLNKLKRVANGENCVASYANFLTVNGGVIIPRFGDDERDAEALDLFKRLYPARKAVQACVNALPCIGGGIHCATQQVPALR